MKDGTQLTIGKTYYTRARGNHEKIIPMELTTQVATDIWGCATFYRHIEEIEQSPDDFPKEGDRVILTILAGDWGPYKRGFPKERAGTLVRIFGKGYKAGMGRVKIDDREEPVTCPLSRLRKP